MPKQDKRDEWVSPFGNLRVKGCSHLTAAYRSVPRPSSPVCAKASTNCPYLTLESPHHQRQRWALPPGKHQLGRAAHRSILVWMINLSQIIVIEPAIRSTPIRRSLPYPKADTVTASILRTHSQCQRGARTLRTAAVACGDFVSSSLENALVEPIGIEPMT